MPARGLARAGVRASLSHVATPEEIARAKETARAKLDRDEPCCGIAAVVLGDSTSPGMDGRSWRALISDGERDGHIDAYVSGSQGPTDSTTDSRIEAAIERRAGGYRDDLDRLGQMLHSSPFDLRRDELS
jgi:hypothetical protein